MYYAYIGELSVKEFNKIKQYFPEIVGTGIRKEHMTVSLGVPNDLPDNVIELYQLIVLCWNNNKATQKAFDAAIKLKDYIHVFLGKGDT